VNHIEGKEVTRQGAGNRQWTRIDANHWEDDRIIALKHNDGRLGRHDSRLAMRPLEEKDKDRNVFGGTPNTAVGTTALPMDRISEHSRLLASIRGWMLKFLIFHGGFT
jgi:hypothetical protein